MYYKTKTTQKDGKGACWTPNIICSMASYWPGHPYSMSDSLLTSVASPCILLVWPPKAPRFFLQGISESRQGPWWSLRHGTMSSSACCWCFQFVVGQPNGWLTFTSNIASFQMKQPKNTWTLGTRTSWLAGLVLPRKTVQREGESCVYAKNTCSMWFCCIFDKSFFAGTNSILDLDPKSLWVEIFQSRLPSSSAAACRTAFCWSDGLIRLHNQSATLFGDGACDHFEVIVLFIHLGKHHDISFDTLLTGQTTLSRKVLQHGRGQFLA